MSEFVREEGATVEEAIDKALSKLGVDREGAEIVVLREPSKGFLGIRGEKALVEVSVKALGDGGVSEDERSSEATRLIRAILNALGLEADVDVSLRDEHILVSVFGGRRAGLLIGKRGETLSAIQTVINSAVRKFGEGPRVVVDVEGYRARRYESLEQLARRAAQRAVATGRAVALGPMNSYERRVVHLALKDNPSVVTESEGEEPDREVIVVPTH